MDWNQIRKQFPVTKKYVYLDAAGGAPISKLAVSEAKKYYDEGFEQGDVSWKKWMDRVEATREKVANVINADKDEIMFTLGASHGMNIIADIFGSKGEVLTMLDEYESSTFPWINHQYKISVIKPTNNVYSINEIEKHISKNTRFLVTSYVQYCTGFKQDLQKLGQLCKKKNLIFIVNATQGIGVMPIDVKNSNIDFMIFMSAKWPMAGYGAGILYINKKRIKQIDCSLAGWKAKENKLKQASDLEVSGPHFPNIFALGGALDFLNKIGISKVQARIYELNEYLEKKLGLLNIKISSPLITEYRSGITIIKMDNASDVVEKLFKKNIIVSARGEGLRVSLHIYNNKGDIDKLVSELQKIIN